MADSSEQSQHVSSSEALRSSSSASSLAMQGAQQEGMRGGPAESSGRMWGDLSGDMQQRLSTGHGQRRSSDSFGGGVPRVYSNERLVPGGLPCGSPAFVPDAWRHIAHMELPMYNRVTNCIQILAWLTSKVAYSLRLSVLSS